MEYQDDNLSELYQLVDYNPFKIQVMVVSNFQVKPSRRVENG